MKRMIMVAVMMLAIIPALLVGLQLYKYARDTVRVEKLNALTGMAKISDVHLTRGISRLIGDVQIKAKDEALISLAAGIDESSGSDSINQEEAADLLLKAERYQALGGALIGANGKVIASSRPYDVGIMLDRTELYRTIMSGKSYFIGFIAHKDISDTLEIAVPIRGEQDKVIGILKQDVSLDRLWDYLDCLNLGQSGYLFLIGRNGHVVSDESRLKQSLLYYEYRENNSLERLISSFKEGRLEKESGIIEFVMKGVDYIGAYEKVDYIDCIAVAAAADNNMAEYVKQFKTIMIAGSLLILFVIVLCSHIFSRMFTVPIAMMNDTLGKISAGDLTARCVYQKNNEFGELSRKINYLADCYQKNEKELRMSSRVDRLTHLPNLVAIYEVLDTLLYKHPNQAVLLLDIADFRELNENLGFDVGDKILMEVGDILRELPQHVCYPSRIGGAEFLVFITNWTAPKYPERIAGKIIQKIEGIRFINQVPVDIRACIGIEYITDEKLEKKKLIRNSCTALHKARSTGGSSYFVHYSYQQKGQ